MNSNYSLIYAFLPKTVVDTEYYIQFQQLVWFRLFFLGGGGVKVFGNKIVGEIGSIIQNTYNKQEMQKQKT